MEEVPGSDEIKGKPGLDRWTLPHTEIRIRRVAEGPRRGEFLFDPETIARAQEFYKRTRDLPYLRQPPIEKLQLLSRRLWRLERTGGRHRRATRMDAAGGMEPGLVEVDRSLACGVGEPCRHPAGPPAHSPQGPPSLHMGLPLSPSSSHDRLFSALWFVPFVADEISNPTGAIANILRLWSTAVAYVSRSLGDMAIFRSSDRRVDRKRVAHPCREPRRELDPSDLSGHRNGGRNLAGVSRCGPNRAAARWPGREY